MSKEWNPENVFEVLGSKVARQILALASVRPLSADDLAEYCGVSRPTIYRRVSVLREYDMLDEQVEISDDGNNYKLYKTNLHEARFRVEDGSYDIDIQLKKDYTDKFAEFWDDLESGTDDISTNDDAHSSHGDDSSSDISGG